MNQQIQKLAEQAGFNLHNDVNDGPSYNYEINKFAELIVAECAMVIERNLFQGIGWNTSRAVKRHFGMEDEE